MAEYHVENFGCRASRADGEAIASGLRQAGLLEAGKLAAAAVVILNTCSVTAEADRSARAYLRRVRRLNPAARVIFTGCYAQRAADEVAALAGVDAVVGNSHKGRLVEVALSAMAPATTGAAPGNWVDGRPARSSVVEFGASFVPLGALAGAKPERDGSAPIWHDSLFAHFEAAALPFAADARQTRPNLKIQDGCGNRCSFCIIPVTRGPSRSVPLEECLRAVEQFVESGGKELVLSGINLGRWGRELAPVTARFEELVAAILDRTALPRLRISSVEPMDWSPSLIGLFRLHSEDSGDGPRLARHAHLPLQSGSDAVLRAMRRRYRPWHYAAKVEAIHAALPEAAIGADVMVGFPGETDAHFRETYDLVEGLPFTYLHIFPFSPRPGTAGFELHRASPVDGEAIKERKAALRALIVAKNRAFRQRFVGSELSVVTLVSGDSAASPESATTDGLSDNFIPMRIAGQWPSNRLLRLRVAELTGDGLAGEVLRSVRPGRFQRQRRDSGSGSRD